MDELAPPTDHERDAAKTLLVQWLDALADNPVVAAVESDEIPDIDRWFVRVTGEAKDVYSIWFTLGQRTLSYETYVMPAPDENHAAFYEQLLHRNNKLAELAFTIGDENAIFLKGRRDLRHLTEPMLDQVIGSVYAAVELCFLPALKVGFASRF